MLKVSDKHVRFFFLRKKHVRSKSGGKITKIEARAWLQPINGCAVS